MSEISLKISGKQFTKFNRFDISLIFNSIASTFTFDGISVSDDQKEAFRPLKYYESIVYYGKNVLITGTTLNTSTGAQKEVSLAGVSGYSKTGVLEDCQVPVELYPLGSDGLNLKEITEKLIKPFGIKLVIDNLIILEVNKVYDSESAKPEQSIKDYLTGLAKQRNVILTHDHLGNLLYTRLKINEKSIATYTEGMPSTSITLSVNGQAFNSKITAMKQATVDSGNEGEATVTNSIVSSYRPGTKVQSSGDNDDTEEFAKQQRAEQLRNIALIIETDRFTWYDGKQVRIIRPNNIVDVISPSNYINRRTRFFVEKVDLRGNSEGLSAIIICVVPEVYNNSDPRNYFL